MIYKEYAQVATALVLMFDKVQGGLMILIALIPDAKHLSVVDQLHLLIFSVRLHGHSSFFLLPSAYKPPHISFHIKDM